jgi:hypothetical protein
MRYVKGVFRDGVARPAEPVHGHDGEAVIITFLDERVPGSLSPEEHAAWDVLAQLVASCAVETGVTDLAHQHDHYLYNKPKRE